ncbi:MAG TPA: hypothetical protein VHQ24_16450 [Lachnospiraceae bacterium]|nr:hypothetical protein [Lachnospiraceae bacterium]
MRQKKIVVYLIIAILAVQSVGCSKGKANPVAMGRYIEEQVDFPKVNAYETVVTSLGTDSDNHLVLYKVSDSSARYARNNDGTWNEEPLEWLNTLVAGRNVTEALITHGLNGSDYAMIASSKEKKDSKASIYRYEADGSVGEIPIERFNEYEVNGNWKDYFIPKNMYIFEDGRILLGYMDCAILYNQDGEPIKEYGEGNGCSLTVSEGKLYILNMDMNQVLVYDIDSGKKINSITVINNGYSRANRSLIHLFTGNKGEIYLQNKDGIHKLSEGGSLWETVVDGTLNSIASPNIDWYMACQDHDGRFYLVSADDTYSIYEYAYNPDVPTVPSMELTIYSLHEDKMITEAALEFQNQNTDVRVSYNVAMPEEDTENEADYIRALNTQILTNNAADIIILDGLDIDSYIEKGVLEDISDITQPMIDSKAVYENVVRTYEHDGRIMAVPISMGVPVVLGVSDAVASSDTLENLAKYIEVQTNQSVFGDIDRKELIQMLYDRYFNEVIDENGKVDLDAITRFFEEVGIISEKTAQLRNSDMAGCTDEIGVLKEVYDMCIENYGDSSDISLAMQIASETHGTWAGFNHQYTPGITVGVNAFGKQKELAKEFVKLLFSEKIQNNWFYEGLPVNRNCVNYNMTTKDESSDVIMNYGYTFRGEFSIYEVKEPSEEDMKKYQEMLDKLDTPIIIDSNIEKKIIDIAESYLNGDTTAYKAANEVINFTSIYYQE